jgi:putative DNA primase/helicase
VPDNAARSNERLHKLVANAKVIPPKRSLNGGTADPTKVDVNGTQQHGGDSAAAEPIPLDAYADDLAATATPPANGSKGKRRRVRSPVEIDPSRPVIDCQLGQRARIVTQVAYALAKTGLYYRRDSAVVRIVALPMETTDSESEIKRKAGSVVMRVADAPSIVRDVSAIASTVKYDMRTEAFRAVDLPKEAALSLISVGAEEQAFKPLTGIAYCPIMRSNGEFETTAGYDERTGFYLAGGEDWTALTVPQTPTRDEAKAAAAWLMKEIYGEFKFVGEMDKAVVLSSVLTAVIRPALDTAPVHCFDAPGHGIGKSMLAELAGIIAMGIIPPMLPPGGTKEETMKRVDSAVLAGDAIVVLDNVSQALTGDALCVAMTAATVSVRPLGSSIMLTVPSSAFWMATGANLQISKDMVRRAVIARVDPKSEHPEQRTFTKSDLKAWVRSHRLEILSNVFIILRAHAQHSFPSGRNKPPPLGSFDQWSRRVANCLLWLDYQNPVASQVGLYDADDARIQEDTLLGALLGWQDFYFKSTQQQKGWQVSDVRAALSVTYDGPARVLRDVIDDTCKNGMQGFPCWIRNVRDRIVNGKRLVCEKNTHTKIMHWKVAVTSVEAHETSSENCV